MSYPSSPAGPGDRGPEPVGYPVPDASPAPRPPSPGARVGRAYGVQVRQESQYAGNNAALALTVLELRLSEPGNPQPLDVLMRGRSLSGTVRDGDWIELTGPPDATNRWNVTQLTNLTTGSTVVVTGGRRSKAATVVILVVLGLALALLLLFVLGVVVSLASS